MNTTSDGYTDYHFIQVTNTIRKDMFGVDRRRNLGPQGVEPLKFAQKSVLDEINGKTTPTHTNKKGKKTSEEDEVKPKAKRFIRTGLSEGSNGSSYVETEGTIIDCALYGPRPVLSRQSGFKTRGNLDINIKFTPFVSTATIQDDTQHSSSSGDTDSQSSIFTNQELESRISSFVSTCFTSVILLDKYPKSSIEIFVKIISLNSKHSLAYLVSLIIDSVSLLLVDSGIQIIDMVTAGYQHSSSPDVELVVGVIGSSLGPENESIVGLWCDSKKCEDDEFIGLIDSCIEDSKVLKKEYNAYFLSLLE